jgi:hypothetical protein
MGRQQQPHDAQAGLGTHRRKHVGEPRDVDGAILNIHTSTNIKAFCFRQEEMRSCIQRLAGCGAKPVGLPS